MANDQPPSLTRPVALLFGDSLTERSLDPEGGWGAALGHHFARKVDVVNRGFGGYNTRWGVKLLEQVLQEVKGRQVALMTIWFGANDAAIPGRSGERQHVPVQEFGSNLGQMVHMAQQAGIHNIILLTPPPVETGARVKHVQLRMGVTHNVAPDRTLEYAQQYAAAVTDLGSKLSVPVVDLYNRLQQVPLWREVLCIDGLHFTPEGSRHVWLLLKEVIEQSYHQLSLSSMSNQFPWWDQWDSRHPDAYWEATLEQLQSNEGRPGSS
eukprot:GHRR01014080.1.p1 GENE.GHRR01014080.1~~GHRR01014080.1.p1  ORF type:complete len:266 (+),score=96.95 GHRR01014080.1:354-1151(+)